MNKHYICGGLVGATYLDSCHSYRIGDNKLDLMPSAVLPVAMASGTTVVLGKHSVWLVGGRTALGNAGSVDVSLIFNPRTESYGQRMVLRYIKLLENISLICIMEMRR